MKWLILGNAILSLILAIGLVFTFTSLVEARNNIMILQMDLRETQESLIDTQIFINEHALLR